MLFRGLIEYPELSVGRLRVCWVEVDAAVEDRAVNILGI